MRPTPATTHSTPPHDVFMWQAIQLAASKSIVHLRLLSPIGKRGSSPPPGQIAYRITLSGTLRSTQSISSPAHRS